MSEQEMQRPVILVVEDDADMARLNVRLLKRQGYEACSAGSAAEALELFKEKNPDLVVLDVGLPDGDGFSLCEQLRQESHVPVLFLTGRKTTGDKVSGLQAGGDYYLTKPYDKEEFLAVVVSLLRRMERVAEHVAGQVAEAIEITKGTLALNIAESRAYVKGEDARLSPKEFALLLYLVQSEGKELAYEAIYENVWGADMLGDSGTVRQTMSRMKKKLDEENADDFAIMNEHGKGYTFMYMGE